MKIKENIIAVWTKIKKNLFWVLFFIGIFYVVWGVLNGFIDKDILVHKITKLIFFGFTLFIVVFLPRRIIRKNKQARKMIIYMKRYYTEIFCYREYFNMFETVHFFFIYTTFYLERILKYIFVGTTIKGLRPYRTNFLKGKIIVLLISIIYRGMHDMSIFVMKIFYEVILFFDTATIGKIMRSRAIGITWVVSLFYIIGSNFLMYYILTAIFVYYIYKIKNIWHGYKKAKEYQKRKVIVMGEGGKSERKDQEQNKGKAFEESLISSVAGFELVIQYSHLTVNAIRKQTIFLYSVLNIKNYSARLFNKYGVKNGTKYFGFSLVSFIIVYKDSGYAYRGGGWPEDITQPAWRYKGLTRFGEKEKWYREEAGTYGLRFGGFERNIEHFGEYETLLDFQVDIFVDIYLTKGSPRHYEWMKEWYLVCCRRYFEFNDIVEYVKRLENIVNNAGGIKEFYNKYFIENGFITELNKGHVEHDNKKITTEELSNKIDDCYKKLLIELKMII